MSKFDEINASVNSLIEQTTLTQEIEAANKDYSLSSDQSVFDYDMLKLYFGEDYHVTDKIIIRQPSLQEIIDYGEKEFYSLVYSLCTNTTGVRLRLWDLGIDWNEMTDYGLFALIIKTLKVEDTKILFGDLDLSQFEPQQLNEEDKFTLIYVPDISIEIDQLIYEKIIDYLRTMFNIHPKVEKAKDKITKEALIDEDRINLKIAQRQKQKSENSILLPLISAALNHPGFKYKKNELRDIQIVEFMDSIRRLQLYENTIALMHGVYGGFVDTSKMDVERDTNFMRDLYEKEEPKKKRNKTNSKN